MEITSYLTYLLISKGFLWIIGFCFPYLEAYLFYAAFLYFSCYAFYDKEMNYAPKTTSQQ